MPTSKGSGSDRGQIDGARRATKKRITDEEWLVHKENIARLYLDEGKDVRDVRDTMKREFGFEAHEKAYKRKFEEWGLTKNVPKEEGLFMVKKREQRREEGKNTVFWRRRRTEGPLQLVPDDKVDRIADRYSHDLNSYPESAASTPENIEYGTPEDTSFPNSVPRSQAEIPTTTSSEWGFQAQTAPVVNGVSSVPIVNGVHPVEGEQQQYFPQEDINMIGHTNPGGMSWDPWSQQYF